MTEFLETLKNWATTQGLTLGTKVLQAVIITVIGLLIIKLVMKIVTTILEKSKLEKAAHGLIKTLAKTVMIVLLGLSVLALVMNLLIKKP
jgi:uncharacterized membrane protein